MRFKALQACHLTPCTSLNQLQSAAHQKELMCKHAYTNWAKEWLEGKRAGKHSDSFSYQHTLIFPPDGKIHPLWTSAQKDPHATSPPWLCASPPATPSSPSMPITFGKFFWKISMCVNAVSTIGHVTILCTTANAYGLPDKKSTTGNSGAQTSLPDRLLTNPHRMEQFLAFLQNSRVAFKHLDTLAVPINPWHNPP